MRKSRRAFVFGLLLFALSSVAAQAQISFVGAADLGNNGGSTQSLAANYTAGSKSNEVLVACIIDLGTNGSTATVTYAGSPMTQAASSVDTNQGQSAWYILNPASGTNSLSYNNNSVTTYIQIIAADYAAVRQSGQPDNSGFADDSIAEDTFSGTFSTNTDSAAAIGCAANSGGSTPTTSGSYTRRTFAAAFTNQLLADDNPVIPHGSTTFTATITNGGFKQGQSFLSLLPVPSGGGLLLRGVGP